MIINGKRYKNLQAYKEKGRNSYLYAHEDMRSFSNGRMCYDAYVTAFDYQTVPCVGSTVSLAWLCSECYPVSFKKLPKAVQNHLMEYVKE